MKLSTIGLITLVYLSLQIQNLSFASKTETVNLSTVKTEQTKNLNQAKSSQKKVDETFEETQSLKAKYRQTLQSIENVKIYNQQLVEVIESQKNEKLRIENEIVSIQETTQKVAPLMVRMKDSLAEFVKADLPFLSKERKKRIKDLDSLFIKSGVSLSEKYRKVLEAYLVENEYGTTIEAYVDTVNISGQDQSVDFLKVGRIGLYYITKDTKKSAVWDVATSSWKDLGSSDRYKVLAAVKMANKQAPPSLLTLPVIKSVPSQNEDQQKTSSFRNPKLQLISAEGSASLNRSGPLTGQFINQAVNLNLFSIIPALISKSMANEKLEGLLKKIQDERSHESELWKEREAEFEKEKNNQSALLKNAETELKNLQNESLRLGKIFDKNEIELRDIEEKKNQVMGAFGELYGTLRQSAGDFNTLILASATSAQNSKRFKDVQKLAQTKRLPEYAELENFWYLLQQEMTLQSQTPSFKSEVVNENGVKEEKLVTRVGAFSNYTGNKFLSFDTKTKTLQAYPRQPERSYTKNLDDFTDLEVGALGLVSFDPSKGTLLETLIQSPTFSERVHQGGLVGYVILIILFAGFMISFERLFYFYQLEKQMNLQLADMKTIIPGNPLAGLIQVFQKYKNDSELDVMTLKLSEVILHEKPKLERGLSTIKTFAGVAPLLGLLGTVTGMIVTFQSITMFGSGDPKLMAGGISQALVTTVQGLVCAIPLLVIYNYVNTKYLKLLTFLQEQLSGMIAEAEINRKKNL